MGFWEDFDQEVGQWTSTKTGQREDGLFVTPAGVKAAARKKAKTPEDFEAIEAGVSSGTAEFWAALDKEVGELPSEQRRRALETKSPTPNAPYRPMKPGAGAVAVLKGTGISVFKGLLYPVSALMPAAYKILETAEEEAKKEQRNFLNKPGVVPGTSSEERDVLAATPGFLGEQVGMALPFIGTMGVARKVAGLTGAGVEALSLGSKTGRQLLAATASGGAFSAAAKLEDGQSRWANVAMGAAFAGAMEFVTIPLWRKAWKAEAAWRDNVRKGAAASYAKVVDEIAARTGKAPSEIVAERITLARAGALPRDVDLAEALAKADSTQGTPLQQQGAKVLAAHEATGLHGPTVADHAVPEDHILSFNIFADGKLVNTQGPITWSIPTAGKGVPTDELFAAYRDSLHQTIGATGARIELQDVVSSSQNYLDRFRKIIMHAEDAKPAPVQGGAPRGSIAETGQVLKKGDAATATLDDGTKIEGVIEKVYAAPREAPPVIEPGTGEVAYAAGVPPVKRFITAEGRTAPKAGPPAVEPEPIAFEGSLVSGVRRKVLLAKKKRLENQILAHMKDNEFSGAEKLRKRLNTVDQRLTTRPPGPALPSELTDDEVNALTTGLRAEAREAGTLESWKEYVQKNNPELYATMAGQENPGVWATAARQTRKEVEAGQRPVLWDPADAYGLVADAKTGVKRELRTGEYTFVGKDPKTGASINLIRDAYQLTAKMQVGEPRPHLVLRSHSDGQYRFGLVDNYNQTLVLEGVDSPNQGMRDAFTPLDPDNDQVWMTRMFIHEDHVQLAFAPTEAAYKTTQFGGAVDVGPQDTAMARRQLQGTSYPKGTGEAVRGYGIEEADAFKSAEKAREVRKQRASEARLRPTEQFAETVPPTIPAGPGQYGTAYLPRLRSKTGRLFPKKHSSEGPTYPAGFTPARQQDPVVIPSRRMVHAVPEERHQIVGESLSPKIAAKYARATDDWLLQHGYARDPSTGRIGVIRGSRAEAEAVWGRRVDPFEGKKRSTREIKELGGFQISENEYGMVEYPKSRFIDPLEWFNNENPDPLLVSLKRSAQILIKEGVDPKTSISASFSMDKHIPMPGGPTMSLDEVANMKFPTPPLSRLIYEAEARGYTINYVGIGAQIISPDGNVRSFSTTLEALYAMETERTWPTRFVLEQDAERMLAMGRTASFDPDVDARKWPDVNMVEKANQRLYSNEDNPTLVEMITEDFQEFTQAQASLAKMRGRGTAEDVSYRAVENIDPVRPKAVRVGELTGEPGLVRQLDDATDFLPGATPRQRVVVFDRKRAGTLIEQYEGDLQTHLGIATRRYGTVDVEGVIDQLGKLPNGLNFLKTGKLRDQQSALLQTVYQRKGMTENFKAGQIVTDEMGTFRTYSQEQKNAFSSQLCPGG